MRAHSTERQPISRPSFVQYFVAFTRLLHGFTAMLPGLVLLWTLNTNPELTKHYVTLMLFFGLITVLIFQAGGVYSDELFSNLLRFRLMFFNWLAAFALLLFMHQALKLFAPIPVRLLVIWFVAGLLLFGAERLLLLAILRSLIRQGRHLQNAVILGGTDNGVRAAEYLRRNGDIRLGVIGFIDDRLSRVSGMLADLPVLGDTAVLEKLIREERVQQVLVALPWTAENRIDHIVRHLRTLPVNVLLVPDMLALRHAHNRITEVSGVPMFNASELPLRGWSPLIKRIEDLFLASLALVLLAPVMLGLALAIKLDSPGPVLFRQKRYGYNNRLIEVYKFRSMYHQMADANAERQTIRGDARVTRVGSFIRRTSLDELPQLFNVVLGSMSMVGPRPHATATKAAGILFEEAVEQYSARHRVKPGITGWAQVNGYRGETDTLEKIEKRVEYDLEYIENWSVWFDLYIIFLTLPAVASSKEAY
ncbi:MULTISPECIES: undecaprenyl-phosphate glucose phosphotransferase [unclassified Pseudomonas]|uniref:undecaprenyl-phosphate glucose phosphotransferase n=1 Tax=unclassified Pseudomonas TaxID=196821 RepID=UPI00244B7606|nr:MULTISPECIES: undecaprenyl-phosphate glucose phosphotransferase [unclassified Pseudomonas]MDG9924020.1 undecaprenyl-phosphate glucose phosphotransferase [Pseudomonas sp. GD04045]MDH0034993.1 undecaprenyl-phosphate glucose phosphotransferase [Pseudomonas sp. GD04019]